MLYFVSLTTADAGLGIYVPLTTSPPLSLPYNSLRQEYIPLNPIPL